MISRCHLFCCRSLHADFHLQLPEELLEAACHPAGARTAEVPLIHEDVIMVVSGNFHQLRHCTCCTMLECVRSERQFSF